MLQKYHKEIQKIPNVALSNGIAWKAKHCTASKDPTKHKQFIIYLYFFFNTDIET